MCFCYYCMCLNKDTNRKIALYLIPIVALCGLLIMFVSAASYVKTNEFDNYLRLNQTYGLILGGLMTPICLLYFFSIYKDIQVLTLICGIILGVMIFCYLTLVIFTLGQDTKQVTWSLKFMKERKKHDYNEIEQSYKCCGIKSYKDYLVEEEKIPLSCCSGSVKETCDKSNAFKTGCVTAVSEDINTLDLVVMVLALIAITFQVNLLAVTLCIYLINVCHWCNRGEEERV